MKSAAAGTFEIGIPSSKANQFLAPLLQAHVYRCSARTDHRSKWRLTSGELAVDCSDDGRECTRFVKYDEGRLNRCLYMIDSV
jgi:hypothetical protein